MKKDNFSGNPGWTSKKGKVLSAFIIGITLLFLTAGFAFNISPLKASHTVSMTPAPTQPAAASQEAARPQYFKKALVFKRTVAESEIHSIRASALADGYKALSALPQFVVVPPGSYRAPQFPNQTILNNFQALSTMGTQQVYSNQNVQQFLTSLNTQQYLGNMAAWQSNLTYQQAMNNLNTQQYLGNMAAWQSNLNYQQVLNNFNNQQYINNFNSMNTQQYNNFNNFNTYTVPSYNFQPMPQFTMPQPSYHFP